MTYISHHHPLSSFAKISLEKRQTKRLQQPALSISRLKAQAKWSNK